MRADRVEERCRSRRRREPERVAELPVEVAATERGIMAVGQPAALGGHPRSHCTQDARLADTRFAREQHRVVLGDRLADIVDERLLGRRDPELGVPEFLGERPHREAEVVEIIGIQSVCS